MNRGLVIAVWADNAPKALEIVKTLGYPWGRMIVGLKVSRIQLPVSTEYAKQIAQGIEDTLWANNIACNVGY